VRALHGGSQLIMSFYSAAHLGLLLKTSTDLVDAQALGSAILKFHVPTLDERARKISFPTRIKLAAEKVATLRDMGGFTPIMLAHPNKVEEEIAHEQVQENRPAPKSDHRDDVFRAWITGDLSDHAIEQAHSVYIDALKLIDDSALSRVWHVASRTDAKEKFSLRKIFDARQRYNATGVYAPFFAENPEPA